jgi:hypothetical protein
MGSEDLVVETDGTVPKKRNRDADRWVRESLERLKTKNKTTKIGDSRCLENSPRNKLPVLQAWLMFQGTGPIKR